MTAGKWFASTAQSHAQPGGAAVVGRGDASPELPPSVSWAAAFVVLVRTQLLFDVVTAFFPFWGFAGIQIRSWNPAAWIGGSAGVVGFFVLSVLLH
jgi:hypothetical protein